MSMTFSKVQSWGRLIATLLTRGHIHHKSSSLHCSALRTPFMYSLLSGKRHRKRLLTSTPLMSHALDHRQVFPCSLAQDQAEEHCTSILQSLSLLLVLASCRALGTSTRRGWEQGRYWPNGERLPQGRHGDQLLLSWGAANLGPSLSSVSALCLTENCTSVRLLDSCQSRLKWASTPTK